MKIKPTDKQDFSCDKRNRERTEKFKKLREEIDKGHPRGKFQRMLEEARDR